MNRFATVCMYVLMVLSTTTVFAQKPITFDKTSHKVNATTGGAHVIQLDDYDMPLGENIVWDYAKDLQTIPANSGYGVLSYKNSTNAKYPNSLQTDSNFVNITPSLGFYTNSYLRQTSSQFEEFTLDNPDVQSYSLTAMSGGANDVLTIPAQTIAYSNPLGMITYPATYGSTWKSRYRYVANTELSVAAFGLSKTPLALVKNVSVDDSVVAWGKASVPMTNGKKSRMYDVLVVRRVTTRQDSFYLAGQPAPVPLMSAFGVSQGSKETIYRYIAYRLESPNYLFLLRYNSDATMTLAPRVAISDIVDEATPSSVEEIHNSVATNASPNPAQTELTLSVSKSNDAPWLIEIYSSLGELVETRMISSGYGDIEIPFSVSHLASGSYRYILHDEQKRVVASKGFVVIR